MLLPAELSPHHYLLFYQSFAFSPYSFFHLRSISRSWRVLFSQAQEDLKQQCHLIFYILPVFVRLSPTLHVLLFCPTPTCIIASGLVLQAITLRLLFQYAP